MWRRGTVGIEVGWLPLEEPMETEEGPRRTPGRSHVEEPAKGAGEAPGRGGNGNVGAVERGRDAEQEETSVDAQCCAEVR